MKELELRLALVCYGGVSLAVYQHGATREILNLVAASKALNTPEGEAAAAEETVGVYLDLLKLIGRQTRLRVILDVIAGSSAGGINGVALARALAHDLSLEPLTRMWLERADINGLIAAEAKPSLWRRLYLRPLIQPMLWLLERRGFFPVGSGKEARKALAAFLTARWFKPPLDGRKLTRIFLDGLEAMGRPRRSAASLLPQGHRLDLIVTATDFHGSQREIFIHDPPLITEREHGWLFRFRYEHREGGTVESDFGWDNLPSLAFAARATASYPGVFPPAQLGELDAVLKARGQDWKGRQAFIDANFRHRHGRPPEAAVLFDGSILNNKPLFAAIRAIRTHSAFRQVDRRLVYIDPHLHKQARLGGAPSFFTTLRGALSDLPRYEPIFGELASVEQLNQHIRMTKRVVAATRSQVVAAVERTTGRAIDAEVTAEVLRRWRLNAASNALATTGLAYNAWIELMLAEAVAYSARLIAGACGFDPGSAEAAQIERRIEGWARAEGVYSESYAMPKGVAKEADLPPWGALIVKFGLRYRRRRLSFLIQTINDLYGRLADMGLSSASSALLDAIKAGLYRRLDELRPLERPNALPQRLSRRIAKHFVGAPAEARAKAPEVPHAVVTELMAQISEHCGLVGWNEAVDALLTSTEVAALDPRLRHELYISYLGFPFWDLVILPMIYGLGVEDAGALEEVLIDRISPEDARTLGRTAEGRVLRGTSFMGFGGFFSRAVRENDYLWGRLHAIDRLIDIVVSAAPEQADLGLQAGAFKKRAFSLVVDRESARLKTAAPLLAELRAEVERL